MPLHSLGGVTGAQEVMWHTLRVLRQAWGGIYCTTSSLWACRNLLVSNCLLHYQSCFNCAGTELETLE